MEQHYAHGPTVSAPVSVETLTHAVEIAGSRERLARALHVPRVRLDHWLSGNEAVPMGVFMDALDFIADGTHPKEDYEPRGLLSAGPLGEL